MDFNIYGNSYKRHFTLMFDIKDSTKKTIKMDKNKLSKYYKTLISYMNEIIGRLNLPFDIIKFTGDGLIITTEIGKIKKLLAFIFALKLDLNMKLKEAVGIDDWHFKFAIAHGFDWEVEIFGKKDFIGDSIRKADRYLKLCKDDYIILDPFVADCLNAEREGYDPTVVKPPDDDDCDPDIIEGIKIKLENNGKELAVILDSIAKNGEEKYFSYKFSNLSEEEQGKLGKQQEDKILSDNDCFEIVVMWM